MEDQDEPGEGERGPVALKADELVATLVSEASLCASGWVALLLHHRASTFSERQLATQPVALDTELPK